MSDEAVTEEETTEEPTPEEAAAAEEAAIDEAFKLGFENAQEGVAEVYAVAKEGEEIPEEEPEPAEDTAAAEGEAEGEEAPEADEDLDSRFQKFIDPIIEENNEIKQRLQQSESQQRAQQQAEDAMRQRAQMQAQHDQAQAQRNQDIAAAESELEELMAKHELQEASLSDVLAAQEKRLDLKNRHEALVYQEQQELQQRFSAPDQTQQQQPVMSDEEKNRRMMDAAVQFDNAVFEAHNDWQQIAEDKAFLEWVEENPLRKWVNGHGTAEQTITLIGQYKALQQPNAGDSASAKKQRQKAAQRSMVASGEGRGRTAAPVEDEEELAMRTHFNKVRGIV